MSKVTITCKNCGQELPAGSLFCDKCGEQVTKRKKVEEFKTEKPAKANSKLAFIVGLGIVLLVLSFMISFMSTGRSDGGDVEVSEESFEDRLSNMTSRITPELYEQIEFGMDYDEVVELLGEEGANDYGRRYEWPGEYFDMVEHIYYAPTIEVEFGHTMKVIGISERNVICGEEIYKAKTEKENVVVLSEEQLASMKARMSYREIADIIGEEGRLTEARSEKNSNESKTYEWRYTKGNESAYPNILNITFYNDKAQRSKYDEWGE